MAVEFYEITGERGKKILFTFDNQDFEILEDTLSVFKKKTGLDIDQYGTTRIAQGHIRLIMDLIELQLNDVYSGAGKSRERLLEIMKKLMQAKSDLLAIGD